MQIKNKLRACVAQRQKYTQHNEPFGTIMQITHQKKKKILRLGGIMNSFRHNGPDDMTL